MNSYLRYREIYGNPKTLFPNSGFSKLVVSEDIEEDSIPMSCRFNPDPRYSNIFAICNEAGDLRFGNTNLIQCPRVIKKTSNGTEKPVDIIGEKHFKVEENAIFDCQWRPSHSNHIWAASGSCMVSLWDVEQKAEVTKFKRHTESVKCLSVCPEEPFLCASGSRDGAVMLWDLRENENDNPKRIISNAHVGTGIRIAGPPKPKRPRRAVISTWRPEPITAVLLCSKNTVVSGSYKPKGIRFWDLRKIYSVGVDSGPIPFRMEHPDAENAKSKMNAGFSSFHTQPNSVNNLYATCTDDIIYSYSLWNSAEPVKTYEGATISTYYAQAAISPNLPYMICGSRKRGAVIWSLDTQQPLCYLDDNRSEDATSDDEDDYEDGEDDHEDDEDDHEDDEEQSDVTAIAWNDRFEILVFYDRYYRLCKLNPEGSEWARRRRALDDI